MYVIRDVFQTKPGQAKALVNIFKNAATFMQSMGVKQTRILTDTVSSYWTVVLEIEVDTMEEYFQQLEGRKSNKEMADAMKGYMDLVTGGHREIFKVE